MTGTSAGQGHDWAERRLRVTMAFDDAMVGSSTSLFAFLSTLLQRDPDALGHAQRVGTMARHIAEELGVKGSEQSDVLHAGWLHDLGKFIMPVAPPASGAIEDAADVLRWTEQLLAATDIMRRVPFLRGAAALVLASRECMDGTGYPYHLHGSSIALGARILNVADTCDALASLCVSLGVDRQAAHVELVRYAGSRFDPDVVAACLRCVDEAAPTC